MTGTPMLFVALCRYGPNAQSLRAAAMDDHLAYLRRNGERLRFAGPLLADDGRTATGSLAIVEAPHRAAAEQFVTEEAFHRAGMFDRVEVHRYASAVGGRQVRITPDPERDLYLCRWTGSAVAPSAEAVLPRGAEAGVRVLEAGVLLDDDGSAGLGGLFVLEADDRGAAHDVVAGDASRRAGAADDVLVSRWRFGRALGGA
jgi:uncharacterized protein